MNLKNIVIGGFLIALASNAFANAVWNIPNAQKAVSLRVKHQNLVNKIELAGNFYSSFGVEEQHAYVDSIVSWTYEKNSLSSEIGALSKNSDRALRRALFYGYFSN